LFFPRVSISLIDTARKFKQATELNNFKTLEGKPLQLKDSVTIITF
jgi:hypothetical protein